MPARCGPGLAIVSDMALDARERFSLADRVVQAVRQDTSRWDEVRLNLLFQQFNLAPPTGSEWETTISAAARIVGDAPDEALLGVAAVMLGVPTREVKDVVALGEDTGLWKDGYVRVFLSHSAAEKSFVGEVSRELAVYGIDGFVAHDSMEVERDWQPQIELALRTAEAFVALVHPPFNESAWCQQEVGWARGRALASYFVRIGADPRGFPSPTQWPSGVNSTAREVAVLIVSWIERQGVATTSIADALVQGLAEAGNYFDAEAAAKRVAELGDLTDGLWQQLIAAYWKNDQVHHGVLATRVLQPFFERHEREFPPEKP